MRTLLLCALLTITTAACDKDESAQPIQKLCEYTCTNLPMDIRFGGTYYLADEVDTIIIRQYTGGGTFSSLLSETLKTFTNNGQYDEYGAIIQQNVYGDGNDYEIEIPGAGQTYRIWNIAAESKTEVNECNSAGHYQCYIAVKEFEISGGAFSILTADANTIMLKH